MTPDKDIAIAACREMAQVFNLGASLMRRLAVVVNRDWIDGIGCAHSEEAQAIEVKLDALIAQMDGVKIPTGT